MSFDIKKAMKFENFDIKKAMKFENFDIKKAMKFENFDIKKAMKFENFDIKKAMKFEKNVGKKDQQIRYGAGAVSLVIAMIYGNSFFLLLGIVLLGSAYLTWCPVMSGLGKNTCNAD